MRTAPGRDSLIVRSEPGSYRFRLALSAASSIPGMKYAPFHHPTGCPTTSDSEIEKSVGVTLAESCPVATAIQREPAHAADNRPVIFMLRDAPCGYQQQKKSHAQSQPLSVSAQNAQGGLGGSSGSEFVWHAPRQQNLVVNGMSQRTRWTCPIDCTFIVQFQEQPVNY